MKAPLDGFAWAIDPPTLWPAMVVPLPLRYSVPAGPFQTALDSAGVLAVGTYRCVKPATPAAYLVSAATGAILTTLPVGANKVFAQPVFAQGTLFVATESGGLYNLAP